MIMETNCLDEWLGVNPGGRAHMVDKCLSGWKKCIKYRFGGDFFYTSETTECAENESVFLIFEDGDLYLKNPQRSANYHLCITLSHIKNFYN